jgi:hypothetical protein
MAYNRKDSRGGSHSASDMVINKAFQHWLYTPKSTGATEVRVLPASADGVFVPQVAPTDMAALDQIGDAFHAKEYAGMMGYKKYSYISETADLPDRPSPSMVFRQALEKAVKEEGSKQHPLWAKWLDYKPRSPDRDVGVMSRPQCRMFIQGVLLRFGGQPVLDKDGRPTARYPVLMPLPRTATTALEKALVTPLDASQPLSAVNSIIGDITSPRGGHTLIIEPGFDAKGKQAYSVKAGALYPLDENFCMAQFAPWARLLRIETAAWQIARLAETFDAESVDFALSDDPDYGAMVPEGVRGAYGRAQSRSTVVAPGLSPMPGLPPPPMVSMPPPPVNDPFLVAGNDEDIEYGEPAVPPPAPQTYVAPVAPQVPPAQPVAYTPPPAPAAYTPPPLVAQAMAQAEVQAPAGRTAARDAMTAGLKAAARAERERQLAERAAQGVR